MKKKTHKKIKILIVLLAVLLVLAMIPVTLALRTGNVAADEGTGEIKEIDDTQTPAAAAQTTQTTSFSSVSLNPAPAASSDTQETTPAQEQTSEETEDPQTPDPEPLEMNIEACIRWLAQQLAAEGTEADLYFVNAAEGTLFDSEDTGAAALTNADFIAAGYANTANTYGWRIVKCADGSFDIYFTLDALDENGKAIGVVKYNTTAQEMLEGTASVATRTAGDNTFFVINSGAYKTTYVLDLTDPEYMAELLYNAATEFWATESGLGSETGRSLMNRCASFFSSGTFVDCPGGTATRSGGTVAGYHIGNDFFAFLESDPFLNFKVYLSDKDANGGRESVIGAEYKYGSVYFLYDPDGLVATRLGK